MNSKMTRTESLVGEFSRNLVGGVKPTRNDVLLQAEQNKKDSRRFNLPISDNCDMLLQELKYNFATWNLNQSFEILDDKIVLACLTILDVSQWQLLSNKLILPRIPGHSQACERMIRRMTESASIYWSKGRRQKHIRARQFVKKFIRRTKRDLLSFVNGLY